MKISQNLISKELLDLVLSPDPLEGEDLLIEDNNGTVIGVIIQPDAYNFLLKKLEELEDANDSADFESYDANAPSLDDLMGDE